MRLGLTCVLAAVLYGIVTVTLGPPSPLGADAPPDVFSAERGRDLLAELLDDESPRPTGSPANFAMRERLVGRLEALGYEVEVQEAPAFENRLGRLKVRNIIATLPGTDPSGVVLLNAHYDSVRRGPGASDDGVAVAALLEVARILKAGPPLKNTIVFLFDDGEEMGLCGAKAFCREHPMRDQIDVVLNFEARGTSGSSLMFETSGANGWLLDVFAQATTHPTTASLFTTIYEALPNDTNLTVYKAAGIPGLNFAFIGDPQNYHTKQDDLAHVTLGSLQHHGDQALALARAFGELDLSAAPRAGDAVFFDVLSAFILRWPERMSLWASIALMVGVLVTALVVMSRGATRSLWFALLAWLGTLGLPILLCMAGAFALDWAGLLKRNLVGNSSSYAMFYWVMSLIGLWLATRMTRSRTTGWSLWVISWLVCGALGIATSVWAPGASYMFLFPLVVALVTALPALFGRRQPGFYATLLPVLSAGLVWFPLHQMLPVALGVQPGWLLGAAHGLFLTTVLVAAGRSSSMP